MTSTLSSKIAGIIYGSAIGEALGIPAEGLTAKQIKAQLQPLSGYQPRAETDDLHALPAGSFARQTEALLAVLKAAHPLPDLQGFASHLKQAHDHFPTKWGKQVAFPWTPFPDEGHYTLSFAVAGALALHTKKASNDDIVAWINALQPASPVWLQAIYVFTKVLEYVLANDPTNDAFKGYVAVCVRSAEEANTLFPGNERLVHLVPRLFKMEYKSFAQFADLCGNVSNPADQVIAYVLAAFMLQFESIDLTMRLAMEQGGVTDAIGAYLGMLWGAAYGEEDFPGGLINNLPELFRLKKSIEVFTESWVK